LRWKRLIILLPGLLIAIPAIYILASIPGALIPGTVFIDSLARTTVKNRQIYLLTSPLHADIAIPVNDAVMEKFSC